MGDFIPVKVCGHCGEVGVSLDTFCQRCKRRGTLADRFRCPHCSGLNDDEWCPTCDGETAFQAGDPETRRARASLAEKPAPDIRLAEPPPWLTGSIGGVVFGAVVGGVIGVFWDDQIWTMLVIGAVLGGIVGAVFSARRP